MIKYKIGDLTKATEDIIAHGCNCVGGFGSGVAKCIAENFPEAKDAYKKQHFLYGWVLGHVQYVDSNNKIIANCATQQQYLPRDIRHADYDAIKICMEKLKNYAKSKNLTIAIPKIGAGLAGGSWDIIELIIKDIFNDFDIVVYIKN